MARAKLIERLLRIRELRLKGALSLLKARAGAVSQAERARAQALNAAQEAAAPASVADLGPLGAARLRQARQVRLLKAELAAAAQATDQARRLHRAALQSQLELSRRQDARRERDQEGEAEAFFGWNNRPQGR